MESSHRGDGRWAQIVAIHEEFDRSLVALPRHLVSRADGKAREASPRTVRFAEALAFTDAWAGITDARRRRTDLAA
jgi:hypothetical protein